MPHETRQYPRYPFVVHITLMTLQEKSYIAQSENLSLGGMFLLKDEPLPPGTQGLLSLTVETAGTKKDITTKFKVVHNKPSETGAPGMGVAFVDMYEEDRTLLETVLTEAGPGQHQPAAG